MMEHHDTLGNSVFSGFRGTSKFTILISDSLMMDFKFSSTDISDVEGLEQKSPAKNMDTLLFIR